MPRRRIFVSWLVVVGVIPVAASFLLNALPPSNGLSASAIQSFRRDKMLPYIQSREMRGGSGAMELKAQSMYDKIEEKLTADKIEEKLKAGLKPTKLYIVDNSHQHAGHAGVNGRNGETHFAVEVVSEAFAGLRPVKRHQLVYSLLAKEMEGGMDYNGIHALEIKAKTPDEHAKG